MWEKKLETSLKGLKIKVHIFSKNEYNKSLISANIIKHLFVNLILQKIVFRQLRIFYLFSGTLYLIALYYYFTI